MVCRHQFSASTAACWGNTKDITAPSLFQNIQGFTQTLFDPGVIVPQLTDGLSAVIPRRKVDHCFAAGNFPLLIFDVSFS